MKIQVVRRNSERGGAAAKLLVVLFILVLCANAGLNYVPVAYNGEHLREEMKTAVVQVMALPPSAGTPADVAKKRIQSAFAAHEVPADAFIDVKLNGKVLQARVAYSKQVPLLPFGLYNYQYDFDYTATPGGFFEGGSN